MSDTAVLDFCLDSNTLTTLPKRELTLQYTQLTLFDIKPYDKRGFGGQRYFFEVPYVS